MADLMDQKHCFLPSCNSLSFHHLGKENNYVLICYINIYYHIIILQYNVSKKVSEIMLLWDRTWAQGLWESLPMIGCCLGQRRRSDCNKEDLVVLPFLYLYLSLYLSFCLCLGKRERDDCIYCIFYRRSGPKKDKRLDQVNSANLLLMFWSLDNIWRRFFLWRRWKTDNRNILVVLGQYRAVLVGTWWYLVSIGW